MSHLLLINLLKEDAAQMKASGDFGWQRTVELAIEALKKVDEAQSVPVLSVWYGAMPETNGKSNWTALLHNGDFSTGFTVARSEYPDRVRYEADRVRYLIGELKDEPFILDYDAEKHSGYVEAQSVPVVGEPWRYVVNKSDGTPLLSVCSKEEADKYRAREGLVVFPVFREPTHSIPAADIELIISGAENNADPAGLYEAIARVRSVIAGERK